MKTIYFLMAMMTTLVSTSQMVDIAFYSPLETSLNGYEFNSKYRELSLPKALNSPTSAKVNVKAEVENMSIYDFKNFGMYDELLDKLKDELLVVHSYKLVKESSRLDPEVHQSYNGEIDARSIELVQNAKDGDQFVLYNILVKKADGVIFRIPLVIKASIKAKAL